MTGGGCRRSSTANRGEHADGRSDSPAKPSRSAEQTDGVNDCKERALRSRAGAASRRAQRRGDRHPGAGARTLRTETEPREGRTGSSATRNAPSCGGRREAPRREERLVDGASLARVRLPLSRAHRAAEAGEVAGTRLLVGIVRRPDPVPSPACAAGEWDMCRIDRLSERGPRRHERMSGFRCSYDIESCASARQCPLANVLTASFRPSEQSTLH